MNVRLYVPSDAESLADLYRAAAREIASAVYSAEQIRAWTEYPDDIEEFRQRLSLGLTLVAEVEGEKASFAQLHPWDHVALLFTSPQFARRGIASALYDLLERAAVERKISKLHVEASRVARPFFERKGFRLVDAEYPIWRGVQFERFKMEKEIATTPPAHMDLIIRSRRLDLIPLTPEMLKASLADRRADVEKMLGGTLPAEWPDRPDVLKLRLQQLQNDPTLQPWLLRAMVLRERAAVVGHIGFHSKPAPDGVELGFTVFEGFRRQGIAREASEALMCWARESHGARRFVLSISPANKPSLALAAQMQFKQIGAHMDAEDGEEFIFEKRLA